MAESSDDPSSYLSWPALSLVTDEPFPGNLYLCIGHRMVHYRSAGDTLSVQDFDKLIMSKVRFVFIEEGKKPDFLSWGKKVEEKVEEKAFEGATEEQRPILEATLDLRRAALDLFSAPTGDEQSKKAIGAAKKMVTEFLKKPYVVNTVSQLQAYNKGTVDHSVNVAVLSVFLGLRMGYSSQVILEHLAVGGLMHDIGKTMMNIPEGRFIDETDPNFIMHPQLGKDATEESKEIANEVRMIIMQHHEYLDGSGFPSKLRGLAIYDLARVTAIANVFDNLVSQSKAVEMKARIEEALAILERDYVEKLDPRKLEKSVKIIRYGLA